ncbi:transposase mutator type [Burkholderia sp. H160]|nr:transposase mutator type [Burkholderia sp. H160]
MTASFRCLEAETETASFDWKSAMNGFAILFGERFTLASG